MLQFMDNMTSFICVESLSRNFNVRKNGGGISEAIRSLWSPSRMSVEAVKDVSFHVGEGERVALIGPNGAGKSTIIKMLTGILRPSGGKASVAGLIPCQEREKLSFCIGCVIGQRSQLWYHLSARESFEILSYIYRLRRSDYFSRLAELSDVFSLDGLLQKRVSQMSLGERMRCEVAASFLHLPKIVLLDEPSIGLDIVARLALRDFIRSYSIRKGVTVILTSHDTGDIEGVCDRVLLVNSGELVRDCTLAELKKSHLRNKTITVQTEDENVSISAPGLKHIYGKSHEARFEVDLEITSIESAAAAIFAGCRVVDISIQDPPLEEIVSALYRRSL